jgi:hypothetical protein
LETNDTFVPEAKDDMLRYVKDGPWIDKLNVGVCPKTSSFPVQTLRYTQKGLIFTITKKPGSDDETAEQVLENTVMHIRAISPFFEPE